MVTSVLLSVELTAVFGSVSGLKIFVGGSEGSVEESFSLSSVATTLWTCTISFDISATTLPIEKNTTSMAKNLGGNNNAQAHLEPITDHVVKHACYIKRIVLLEK